MKDDFPFAGRGWMPVDHEPAVIQADAGNVLFLVITMCNLKFVTYYRRMAVIDQWGIRMVNPFRRLSYSNLKHDFADCLPRDLHIIC